MQKSKCKNQKFSYNKVIFIFAFCFLFSPFSHAHAATLYFDPEERIVGQDQEFKLGLLVDADKPVNAFNVIVNMPSDMTVVDSSDGNSIVNYWIERPTFDATKGTLEFSGIVPGGFSGKGGRLLVLTLKAHSPGIDVVTYDSATDIIRNGPTAVSDPNDIVPVTITIETGKESSSNVVPDIDPPESFTPYLATSSAIFGGQWAVYFQAEDKGSGMYGYEVAEWPYKTSDYASLPWRTAESPYVLADQGLTSYVYVKATDKAGNSRMEILPPKANAVWPSVSVWVILILVILISLWAKFRQKDH